MPPTSPLWENSASKYIARHKQTSGLNVIPLFLRQFSLFSMFFFSDERLFSGFLTRSAQKDGLRFPTFHFSEKLQIVLFFQCFFFFFLFMKDCSLVSWPEALKMMVCVFPHSISVKSYRKLKDDFETFILTSKIKFRENGRSKGVLPGAPSPGGEGKVVATTTDCR